MYIKNLYISVKNLMKIFFEYNNLNKLFLSLKNFIPSSSSANFFPLVGSTL